MTPGPSIDELINTVRTDAGSDDPLEQLATASRTVAELEEVADAALTHFVDQCRRGGRSWAEISKALGVTKQAAHKRFSYTPPTLERFTPRARAVLPAAAAEALRLGHNYVGTEHLLLALFGDPESVAAKTLADLHVNDAEVEAFVVATAPASPSSSGAPPFSVLATECIKQAVAEALQLAHNYVGTEHILLALFRQTDGLAAKALTQLGATHDGARARVIQRLSGYRAGA